MATTLKFVCEKFRLMDLRFPDPSHDDYKGYYAQFIACVTGHYGLPPFVPNEEGKRWKYVEVQGPSGTLKLKRAIKPTLPPKLDAPENDAFFLKQPRAQISLNNCPEGSFEVGKVYTITIEEDGA